MILLLDNYDSFTWNLVHLLERADRQATVDVVRHDAITVAEIETLAPQAVVLSAGPGRPEHAGITLNLLRSCAGRLPILGVCLGHQCIVAACGGRIGPARRLMHGKTCAVRHDGSGLFAGLPSPFEAARYHSLAAQAADLPSSLRVCARAEDGEIMGVAHRRAPLWGVQFHPESFLSEYGELLMVNFLTLARAAACSPSKAAGKP